MTDAEVLLELAQVVLLPRNRIVSVEGLPHHTSDTIALAIKFSKKSSGFKLRAIMECWRRDQIVRELY